MALGMVILILLDPRSGTHKRGGVSHLDLRTTLELGMKNEWIDMS